LVPEDDDDMFMTKSFNVTPTKTTEQYLIGRSNKYVAYITNNKRFCSTFCTIEANDWQTRSTARLLCDSTYKYQYLSCWRQTDGQTNRQTDGQAQRIKPPNYSRYHDPE